MDRSRMFLRSARALSAAAVAVGLVGGCNWTTFADDADQAPVRSIEAPSSFKSNDFGRTVLPLSDGQGKAAAFIASSINDNTIALVTIDASGAVSSRAIPGTALNDTEASVISSLAEDRGVDPPLKLLLGTPKVHNQGYGRFYTYPLTAMLDGTVGTKAIASLPAEESGLGRGVAVGRLAGTGNVNDYVVASDDHLVVLVDGAAPTPPDVTGVAGCDTTFDPMQDARYRLRRALLTAALWPDPSKAEQLVSASPHAALTPGKLSFFSVTGSGSAFSLSCVVAVTAPGPEMRPRFGTSLASGDFNGDGMLDLLVGAPGQHAYIYFGPFPPGGVPTPLTISDPDGVDFGYAVAALDVDGKSGQEALIGDPYATVDGQERAGRVRAYSWNASSMTMEATRTYSDHSPQANANFGSTVNALRFCSSASSPAAGVLCSDQDSSRVLMVGASNEVFVYFREGTKVRGGQTILDVRAP